MWSVAKCFLMLGFTLYSFKILNYFQQISLYAAFSVKLVRSMTKIQLGL